MTNNKKRIRLLQITHDLSVGGLQQVVLTLCRSIDKQQYEIIVLCLRELGDLAKEVEKTGAKVILLPQKDSGTDYFSFLKIAKIIQQIKPDVIHTHNTQPLVEGVLGCIAACRLPKIVHTDHARQFPDKKRYMFAEWCASHFVHKMVGVSQKTTENLRRFERISPKKLVTIENGIILQNYQITIDRTAKRQELNLPESGSIVGVIARLEPVKGVTFLLKAAPAILAKYPDTLFLIVGDGSEKDSLIQESRDLGITDNVFFTGVRHDVPQLLKLFNIYVLPSISEGLPMGLLEAMAAGCPVVATSVGGVPGVLGKNEKGLLVESESPGQLASFVLEMFNNSRKRDAVIVNAVQYVDKHFSSNAMLASYIKLYQI
jgi:glycosyltransferase involved in cell wall biosynthesis